ncbi:nuclease-related domain-containing protein [Nocardioides aquiterrae]|uniref:NERD domain-containing protein n=1 Tax=Nocardioides aquiterrae TaxID=203799 RepID=A0ABN1UDB0_9ACTN
MSTSWSPPSTRTYERGLQGRGATAGVLGGLRAEGWAVFHDVTWPGRQRVNQVHVAVGPGGVFVVDGKNWSVRIALLDDTIVVDGWRHDEVAAAAARAARAVADLVGPPAAATVVPVLCFVRDQPLTGRCHDVLVCSTANLRETLLARPAALTPDQVRTAARQLHRAFRVRAADVSRAGRQRSAT